MWIVRLALRRPYTFVVMAMLILLLGMFAVLHMPTDIFPEVDIPVISVVWQYTGMSPEEMEGRIIRNFEGILTTTVNDIEHIESQSINGEGIIRIYFQPGAKICGVRSAGHGYRADGAPADAAGNPTSADSSVQRLDRADPATVAGQQHARRADSFSTSQTSSCAPGLATVQGAMLPCPYGGQATADHGGSGAGQDVRLRPVRRRRLRHDKHAKSDRSIRHRQDRHTGISRLPELEPDLPSSGLNDLPIKTVERLHRLHQGCRPRQRQIHAADEHGPHRWEKGCAGAGLQARRRLDARHRSTACWAMLPDAAGPHSTLARN